MEVIITGVDEKGGHLYFINDPGADCVDYHLIGYHAIGIGAIHALQAMISFAHTPNKSLEETLLNVYTSKKRSEVAPGVGKDTDVVIINNKGINVLTVSDIQELDKIYQDYKIPIVKEKFINKIKNMSFFKQENANAKE